MLFCIRHTTSTATTATAASATNLSPSASVLCHHYITMENPGNPDFCIRITFDWIANLFLYKTEIHWLIIVKKALNIYFFMFLLLCTEMKMCGGGVCWFVCVCVSDTHWHINYLFYAPRTMKAKREEGKKQTCRYFFTTTTFHGGKGGLSRNLYQGQEDGCRT